MSGPNPDNRIIQPRNFEQPWKNESVLSKLRGSKVAEDDTMVVTSWRLRYLLIQHPIPPSSRVVNARRL